MTFSDKSIKRFFLFSSMGLFAVSLTQECYCTGSECGNSFLALLFGGLGFCLSPAGFSWLANPSIIGAWSTFNKYSKDSLILSLFALSFSLLFLFFNKVADDESGELRQITAHKLGYWLWLSSMIIMAVGNLILYLKARKQHHT